ncbi:alpha/beta hydrolase-fold protein [Robiginitalea sp. M366]|uniref:alpha/beta hydrolase n=1 Tax=Robiginitalea aestuariiviva TaxID=3036903 RepID=UPI00240E981E|nr:alpha/beta hydrolase-fold protein [Robiginitalea aestuariiviva]MDG1571689.1 alpha/beta hydrolase-fold protein [Robiginitalea aestuariiviva]
MKRLLSALLTAASLMPLSAQVKQEIFESFKLQERRDVTYYIPENYTPEKQYPLVVVLDAERLFHQVVAASRYHSKYQGMPEALIVGIHQEKDELRWYDCAFEEDTGLPSDKGKGFFEFIGLEIVPYMVSAYNVAPFKMIIGYDITANFGNYYLFKERSLFNAFISISPLLAPEMESRIPQRLADLEQQIFYHLIADGRPGPDLQRFNALDAQIRQINRDGLHYYYDLYPEADENAIGAYGIGKAWDRTFSLFKPISPTEYREKILTSDEPVFNYLENKYATIEDLFGFRKRVELDDILAIYAGCRKKEDTESLKPLSDLCKEAFPDTMLGFYFEAEYYEQMGEPKKALRTFEKAFGMEEIDFLTKEMALEKMDALKADFGF